MQTIIRLVSLSFILFICSQPGIAQTWQWASNGHGTSGSSSDAITTDKDGNIIISGIFQNTITFGSVTLNHAGASFFIAKYDENGGLLWAKTGGGAQSIFVNGICVDKNGSIAITGRYFGTAAMGQNNPVSLVSGGDYDVFVARYSPAGDIDWAQSAGGPGIDFGYGIGTDNQGNLFVTGDMHISSFSGSSSKIFLARYDSTGVCSWLKTSKTYGVSHIANGIRTDSLGNSYVIGNFFNYLTFDSTTILDAGNVEANCYVVKFNGNGDVLWMQKAGAGSGYTGGNGLGVDAQSNTYITGFFKGTISLGPFSLSGVGNLYQCFIAKIDPAGNYEWAKQANGQSIGLAISVDQAGTSYIAGSFMNSFTMGPVSLINTGNGDAFVAKADAAGNILWGDQAGGDASLGVGGIAHHGNGVYLTGGYLDTLSFGQALSLPGDTAIAGVYLARLDDKTTSVEGPEGVAGISIYPNPATEMIYVNGGASGAGYRIYSLDGRLAGIGSLDKTGGLSISGLKTGPYVLSVTGSNRYALMKASFIKL